ncbi:hypothetical protein ACJJTC_002460 [Scirpophaga incertulas]
MSNFAASLNLDTQSEILSFYGEITLEDKTESETDNTSSPQNIQSPLKSSRKTSHTQIKANVNYYNNDDFQSIVQYSNSDSSDEYDADIMKFQGDKLKYKFRGSKKKFKIFRKKRIDKYLEGIDYVCVNKNNNKCNDYMYIELPKVHKFEELPKEAMRIAANKEAKIMILMKEIGVNCPKFVYRNNHILVTTFIGDNGQPAKKLTEITMKPYQWLHIYTEVIEAIYKIYNRGKVIHGNLNPCNILWWQNKCWFVNFSPLFTDENLSEGFQTLFRDCKMLSEFFKEKGAEPQSGEYLFTHITGEENWWKSTYKPHTPAVRIRP